MSFSRLLFLIAGLVFCAIHGHAQINIVGEIVDGNNRIEGASIILKDGNNRIIGYGASDEDGKFSFRIGQDSALDSILLEVKMLGYKPWSSKLPSDLPVYKINLEKSDVLLETVDIKSHVQVKGDTISYSVKAYSNSQDVTIEDVLKRMPGIEVKESGEISFQGKLISHLYIDGDDLLAGKYTLGTRTISHEMIDKLEVLQNHQPIKMLQNRQLSDNVALNLVVDSLAATQLVGQMDLGAGLPSNQRNIIDAILLSKKLKLLNTIKTNNIGDNYENDRITALSNLETGLSEGIDKLNYLSMLDLPRAAIPLSAYNRNLIGSLSLNNLKKLKNDYQLRLNSTTYLSRDQIVNNQSHTYFLPNDSLYTQLLLNESRFQTFRQEAQALLQINENNKYITNQLKIDFQDISNNTNTGDPLGSLQPYSAERGNIDFQNNLRWIPSLKKTNDFLIFEWLASYRSGIEDLTIDSVLSNLTMPFALNDKNVLQKVANKEIASNVSIGYNMRNKTLGNQNFVNTSIYLRSQLLFLNMESDLGNTRLIDTANRLQWNDQEYIATFRQDYMLKKWKIIFSLPLRYRDILYSDQSYSMRSRLNQIWLDPNLQIRYPVNNKLSFRFDLRHLHLTGTPKDIFRGAILTNTRALNSNLSELAVSTSSLFSLKGEYQYPVNGFMATFTATYQQMDFESLPSMELQGDVWTNTRIPWPNSSNRWITHTSAEKNFFYQRTKLSLEHRWQIQNSQVLLSQNAIPIHEQSHQYIGRFDIRYVHNLAINLAFNIRHTIQESTRLALNATHINSYQRFGIQYSVANWSLAPEIARYAFSRDKQSAYNFYPINFIAQHNWVSKNILFKLEARNLTNAKYFHSTQWQENLLSANTFSLRGLSIMLSAKLNFRL